MKKLNNKGFSLVEILVAIAILAVLMSVAAQAYNAYKKQARQQAYDTMAKSATVAATNYLMENNKAKYITFDILKELQYVDTLQDPRYKEKECSGIVINKVVQGETQKQLDVLFQKVKLCCKNYKYQYDYTGDDVKVTEIENCEYVEGDEIDGIYKLIYKPQGGASCDPGIVMKKQREEWGPLCITTKENYVFKGWNTKKNGSGSTITEHTLVGDRDVNAYAIWNPIYTLTFNEDGGTICNPKTIDKENGEKWGTLCETSKTGYAFKGWTTKKDGKGSKITKDTYAEKNITAYAHWNPYYTLTFDSNEGNACNPKTITKEKDEEWGTLCKPTRTGYVFIEWNTKKDGTGTKITKSSKVSQNMTVYAIWNPKYTLTFDSNEGSTCDPKTITEEKGKKWGTLCKTTRTGYTFGGWYNGTTKVTESTTVENTITVKAKWTANTCTLTYNNNGGSGCSGSISQSYSNAWGTLCKNSVREHYKFIGWNTKADGSGTNVTDTTSTTKVCDSTIYAQWTKKNYTLSFSGNGSTNCTSITKAYDTKWGKLCTPAAQTGYSFKGWYNGDTQVTADSKANATISVTSKWDPNQYTLTYNNNGGTGCTSKKGYYASAWGTLCKPSNPNHIFDGWYDANGNKVTETTVCWGDKSVTAHWKSSSKTTTVSGSGQSANSTITITMAATNPDKDMPIVGTPSSGTANCVYSGDNIVCTITGVNSKSVVDTTDCRRAAKAKGLSSADVAKVSYIKSTPYNSADAFEGSEGDGCYLHYNNSAFFTENWSCKRAPTTIFPGETDHCPKKKNCGGSKCYTYGFVESGNGYKCQCWIRLTDATYKTYYYATITATYYQYA